MPPAVQNKPDGVNFVFIMALTRYTQDDHPYVTYFSVDEDVSGNADVNAILVMDGVSDAWVSPYKTYIYSTCTLRYRKNKRYALSMINWP